MVIDGEKRSAQWIADRHRHPKCAFVIFEIIAGSETTFGDGREFLADGRRPVCLEVGSQGGFGSACEQNHAHGHLMRNARLQTGIDFRHRFACPEEAEADEPVAGHRHGINGFAVLRKGDNCMFGDELIPVFQLLFSGGQRGCERAGMVVGIRFVLPEEPTVQEGFHQMLGGGDLDISAAGQFADAEPAGLLGDEQEHVECTVDGLKGH